MVDLFIQILELI